MSSFSVVPAGAENRPAKYGYMPLDMQRCESIQDCLAAGGKPVDRNYRLWKSFDESHSLYSGHSWYGVSTLREVKEIVDRQQWPEGADRLSAALDNLSPTLKPRNIKRQRRWGAQGDTVEMTRVWAGRLDTAWQRTQREQRSGAQRVTIYADVSINCNISSEVAFWRGASAVKLADLLTNAGYAVQIDVVNTGLRHSSSEQRSYVSFTTVKPSTAPLDLVALASTVCLPGFYRYHLFRLQSCTPTCTVSSSLGQAIPVNDLIVLPEALVVSHDVVNAATAREWINRQLVKIQGEELAGEAMSSGVL